MRFFVPAAQNDQNAEKVVVAAKKFAKMTMGWDTTERKIYGLKYRHDGKDYTAMVGDNEPRTGEMVIVILESDPVFLVCTPNRGLIRGEPMLVGKNEVSSVIDFE